MRLMFSRIRTAHHTVVSLKRKMPDSPALSNPDFEKALKLSTKLREELRTQRPEIRKKIKYIMSKAKRWRKMILEQRENNNENENESPRERFRGRRLR